MMAGGASQQTVVNRFQIDAENPALAAMDRAIRELAAHAKLLAAARDNSRSSNPTMSTAVMRSISDIRQIIASVLGDEFNLPHTRVS